ncbi:MAG TPA: LLM class flavin-dependent oxidoreductase [Candidatus Avipropionibacterium avicola]|uniref:LLM class flavin-dependent oxidoreductase n=1 Tax=Candidatus Avipropionibacterium avicola TaxID=2840701 RepID=A0A9D1GYE1_9ACTN|nr:LLM class flavin-dependent oxidoreductase [Candidatus Avipropionibacterium avicola]
MSELDISIRIPLGHPLPDLADFAVRCEAAGFDGVGIPDHHHTGRDAYVTLSAMALATQRIRLFPATSNTVTRHPLVLASLLNSLDELAPGRAMLTVAPGFLSVEKAGAAPERRARLREVLLALRGLLHEGHAEFEGQPVHLDNCPGERAEVILLASGPKLLELAGEAADGVMMLVGLHPDGVAAARRHLRIGAERAGRDVSEIEEIFIVPADVGDPAALRAYPQGWFREGHPWLSYPSPSTLRWLRASGLELADPFDPASVSDGQADAILDALGAFGTPEQVADRLLRAKDELGLRRAFLFPGHTWDNHYELPARLVEAWSEVIGPRLSQQ